MYSVLKRIFDFIFALTALLILLPLFIVIIIGLLFTGEHEIFYFQERIGYRNKPFYIWKFATMLKNSPNIGTGTITLRNDPRVTIVGRFLRKSKLNELPQFINVLIGNMSVVGPRPLDRKGYDAYPDEIREKIYNSKPGITGIGSIIFRDEEFLISNANMPPSEFYKQIIAPYKGKCEIWYNEHKSLLIDFQIIILTAIVVILPENQLVWKWFKSLPKRNF